MKIMTGVDLHSNNALCGLMDESGRHLLHKKLPPCIVSLAEPTDIPSLQQPRPHHFSQVMNVMKLAPIYRPQ
jgi:hypothetical protein